jgi:ketosteroid isomerase-like protein
MRVRRDPRAVTLSVLLLSGGGNVGGGALVLAQQPTNSAGGSAGASPATQGGGFVSSLRQAFGTDFSREVVRGHFDVSSPSGSHRFYCLIDPKTGKREPNAVSGEPYTHRDGTTGLKTPAVSPASCAEAEQKGTLVTAGYVVPGGAASEKSASPRPAEAIAPAPPPAIAPAPAPAPTPTPAPAPAIATAAVPTAGAAGAPAASNTDRARDRAYIRQAESDWAESVATRDASVPERILSEDFVGVDVDGAHYSKADAIKEYRSRPSNYTSNHLNQVEIRFYGDTAVAQGDESWQKKDGSSGRYVWTDTWVRREGTWRIVAAEDLVAPAEGFHHP